MKVKVFKKQTKSIKDFEKREWIKHDISHYGKEKDWKKKEFYLAYYDKNKIVGSLSFVIEAKTCFIKTLIIAEEKREQGLGKKLMAEAEKISKKNNVHKVYLETGKGWEAEKFYKSLGYQITGEHKNHYYNRNYVILAKFFSVICYNKSLCQK